MTNYDLGLVTGAKGDKGDKGDQGNPGVKGDKGDTGATGAKGDTGRGISNIQKTGTSGLIDTYTINYTDNTTSTYTVTNGSDATVDIVTAWEQTLSDSKVPSEKLTKDSLDGKANSVHIHNSTDINDSNSNYPHIHPGLPSTQNTVHDTFLEVDTAIGDLQDLIGDISTIINGTGS